MHQSSGEGACVPSGRINRMVYFFRLSLTGSSCKGVNRQKWGKPHAQSDGKTHHTRPDVFSAGHSQVNAIGFQFIFAYVVFMAFPHDMSACV